MERLSIHGSRRQDAFSAILPTPFGAMGITSDGLSIESLEFLDDMPRQSPRDALSREACRQIAAYMVDPAFRFDLPLKPVGTDFQNRVWRAIAEVTCGERTTYGAIARALNSSARAVGQACGDNAYPLAIPCHRVVSAHGMGGFAHHRRGFLLRAKHWLLAHEARGQMAGDLFSVPDKHW